MHGVASWWCLGEPPRSSRIGGVLRLGVVPVVHSRLYAQTGGPSMPNDTDDESIEERVERLVTERLNARQADAEKADRLKKLGLTGDVLDAIADAVWDRGEDRAANRRKADEDADQAPTTAKPRKKQGGLFGLFPVTDEPTGTDD